MRIRLVLLTLLMALGAASPSFAEITRTMCAHLDQLTLVNLCIDNGGVPGWEKVSRTYWCTKENCDNNGGGCTIMCDLKECKATTPDRILYTTILGILRADLVKTFDGPDTSTDSLVSGGTGKPVNIIN
ncbi:MAG TPA: hypothetical protein VG757_04000 [Devosia sp.]|nr:hypothetical protein [Devosia sp.]